MSVLWRRICHHEKPGETPGRKLYREGPAGEGGSDGHVMGREGGGLEKHLDGNCIVKVQQERGDLMVM